MSNWSRSTMESGNVYNSINQAGMLSSKIMSLESQLNMQEREICRLLQENETLKKKRKLEVVGISVAVASKKKYTVPQVSNNISTFNLILENDISEKYLDIITGSLEEYKVEWESQNYVILNAFNNRDEIFNYYCPLFESKYPEKVYRLVLERDDYKKLFKENKHLSKFFKMHAWRISIFSIEFFHFVRKSKNIKDY
ncbi:predicted protein [Naegleria gruberi]|uniref:Predicted protein n=1 Tax=Naegleria gruberi TaxID=5762 RepID=D2VKM4_NAEGR|nr:uncharacterized protein NAEGRDRAFT_69445 [Naegleria gruberi]EFC42713.1 predicted protein [Naegleria gruberi]|eukprot:XP_002675457.1 predicted protein [Naegleria gruberi strain NEG-M]